MRGVLAALQNNQLGLIDNWFAPRAGRARESIVRKSIHWQLSRSHAAIVLAD